MNNSLRKSYIFIYNKYVNIPDFSRSSFDSAAADYDAVRPGYPDALIEDVVSLSGITPGGRALEIGCGTGQATLPFAKRGYRLLCLDIGPELLKIAAQKFEDYPNVSFLNNAFERWPARIGKYELVYAATAWHWIPPEIGYPKAALVLKPGGALAIFSNKHPGPYSGFFEEVQPIYEKYVPEWKQAQEERPSLQAEINTTVAYIDSLRLFRPVIVRTYPWAMTYSTAEYIRLLNTYSDHRALSEDRRGLLFQAIRELIERRYNGQVERPYLSVLYLMQKS